MRKMVPTAAIIRVSDESECTPIISLTMADSSTSATASERMCYKHLNELKPYHQGIIYGWSKCNRRGLRSMVFFLPKLGKRACNIKYMVADTVNLVGTVQEGLFIYFLFQERGLFQQGHVFLGLCLIKG